MRIKCFLQNWILKYLLNAVLPSDIITYSEKTKQIFINKTLITEEELRAIAEEVKLINGSRIWALLQGTLAIEARGRIFNHSKTIDDIIYGKALLYNLDLQNKIFNLLLKIK